MGATVVDGLVLAIPMEIWFWGISGGSPIVPFSGDVRAARHPVCDPVRGA
jgi:hypothetical protein